MSTTQTTTAVPARFIVDRGSFGPEGGKVWVVWDMAERRIVDWCSTKRAAQASAHRMERATT